MHYDMNLSQMNNSLVVETAKNEIRQCNNFTEQFGLTLSEEEITELVEGRKNALKSNGRIEFGGGILPKLIYAFCDSPFVEQSNYEGILAELQDAFYYYKNESLDQYTDDELIEFMVKVFNGKAQGSVEYLLCTSLEMLCRCARSDYDPEEDEEGELF